MIAFNDENIYGDWSGAVEIYERSDEDTWHRFDVIERGTSQQGIAEIAREVTNPAQLLTLISDENLSIRQRNSAVALFGCLGYRCQLGRLENIGTRTTDITLRALLTWLRRCIIIESEEDEEN